MITLCVSEWRERLSELLEADRYGLDPKKNHWKSIYPVLTAADAIQDRDAMLRDFKNRPRSEIVFLYLHIPYCARKCTFCHFYISTDSKKKREYLQSLAREMLPFLMHLNSQTLIRHVYTGGGTPSLLSADLLMELYTPILERIPRDRILRRTLELHPRTLKPGLEALVERGIIDRVSMGVQSFDHGVLDLNNRVAASPDLLRQVAERFRAAGTREINLDLMAGLRGQTPEIAARDIELLSRLIEEGLFDSVTVYPRSYTGDSNLDFVPETPSSLLVRLEVQILYRKFFEEQLGWREYPTYFYSRPIEPPINPSSCASAEVVNKLGFGNSAYSYFDGTNYRNVLEYEAYLKRRFNGATAARHRLERLETLRRQVVFEAKRGVIELNLEGATETENGELNALAELIVAEGLGGTDGEKLMLNLLGQLLVEWVIVQAERLWQEN